MGKKIGSSLANFLQNSPLNEEEINELRKKCYEMGLIVLEIDRIKNDFVKQGIINVMNAIHYDKKKRMA